MIYVAMNLVLFLLYFCTPIERLNISNSTLNLMERILMMWAFLTAASIFGVAFGASFVYFGSMING